MARRADRKLNPDAVKAANAAVGNRTLHATDPVDADARKRWMDAYETANGRPMEDSSSNNSLVDSPSQTCDPTWCEIRYKYADGTGVPNADYLVLAIDSVSGMQKEYKGKVDSSGFARVEGLPAGCSVVSCSFDNDPKDWEPFPSESPKPHGLKNLQLNWPKKQESLPGMEIAPTDGAFFFSQLPTTKAIIAPYIDAFAEWMKPIILGDWDEADPSYGQIAVRTAIEMIPVVDQIADVRDLAAAVNKLVIDERYDEFWVWFDFVTTLVGCIPEVGSALKGLLRAFGKAGGKWVGPTTEAIFRWMNKKGKGNAVKKITQWANELESKIKGEVLKLGTQILENSKKLLEQLKNWAMGVYDPLATWAAKKVENFVEVLKNFPERVNEILSSVRKGLNDWKAKRKGKRETADGQTNKHNTDGKNNTAPTEQQQKGDIGEGPRDHRNEIRRQRQSYWKIRDSAMKKNTQKNSTGRELARSDVQTGRAIDFKDDSVNGTVTTQKQLKEKSLEEFHKDGFEEAKRLSRELGSCHSGKEVSRILDRDVEIGLCEVKEVTLPAPDGLKLNWPENTTPDGYGRTRGNAYVGSQTMRIYEYPDGTVVRVKFEGDPFRNTGMTYSVEAKHAGMKNPDGSWKPDAGPDSIAFKLDKNGNPVPKNPGDTRQVSSDAEIQEGYQNEVMDSGHRGPFNY